MRENSDLRSTDMNQVFAWELPHVHIQVLWLLKKEYTRIKYKLNFWRQANSVPLSPLPFREPRPLTLPVLQHPNHAMPFYCIPVSKHDTSIYGFHHSHSISFQPSHLPPQPSSFLRLGLLRWSKLRNLWLPYLQFRSHTICYQNFGKNYVQRDFLGSIKTTI